MKHVATWLEGTQLTHHTQVVSYDKLNLLTFLHVHTQCSGSSTPYSMDQGPQVEMSKNGKCQLNSLYCNCHEKYSPRYKFKEQKLFMVIF